MPRPLRRAARPVALHVAVAGLLTAAAVAEDLTWSPRHPVVALPPSVVGSVLADVTGDGRPDLITLASRQITIAAGLEDGSFDRPAVALDDDGLFGLEDLVAWDADGDGDVDLAGWDRDGIGPNEVAVIAQATPGRFVLHDRIDVSISPADLATGDLTGDGIDDLAISFDSSSPRVSFIEGHPDLELDLRPSIPIGGPGGLGVDVGDVTGDGVADLVTAISLLFPPRLVVLPGTGEGDFGFPIISGYSIIGEGHVTLVDVDADGDLDAVVWGPLGGDEVEVLENVAGVGFFLSRQVIELRGPRSISLELGDPDGDGDVDLLLGASPPFDPTPIQFLLNDGSGTFAFGQAFEAPRFVVDAVLEDLDGDGRADLVVTTSAAGLVALQSPDGRFDPAPGRRVLDSAATSIDLADVDGDGRLDLLIAHAEERAVRVRRGAGDGTFVDWTVIRRSEVPRVVRSRRDDEGRLEIVVGDDDGVDVLRDDGDGFEVVSHVPMRVRFGPASVSTEDLDGDGRTDLVVGDRHGVVRVAFGRPGGGYGDPLVRAVLDPPPGEEFSAVQVIETADLDGDGDLDVLAGGSFDGFSGWVASFRVGPSEDLRFSAWAAARGADAGLAAADVNRDGRPDVVTTRELLLAAGDLTFGEAAGIGRLGERLFTVDLDGDGTAELIAADDGISRFIHFDGPGGPLVVRSAALGGRDPIDVSTGDLDGDGVLDVVVLCEEPAEVYVTLGRSTLGLRP